jgi:hypothetical protein
VELVTAFAALLLFQLSAGAVVARVKENDAKLEDLDAVVRLEIREAGKVRTRVFDMFLLREEKTFGYRARIRIREPEEMLGTEFLIHAERGKRNHQWAFFPDLDLVREIAGKSEDDPFLGSDITYADLAGGAHLDDLHHRLVDNGEVSGEPAYLLEGVPKHRIAYGKLRGYVRKKDFVVVRAEFFDHEGGLLKEARLSDVRDLGGVLLAHRIEIRKPEQDRSTVMVFEVVKVNEGLEPADFTPESLGKSGPK